MGNVKDHYDAVSETYYRQYDKEKIYDIDRPYPANYFRMQLMINSFLKHNAHKVLEVGVGEGTPLLQLHKAGFDVYGFDISKNMVEKAQTNFRENDSLFDIQKLFYADICDASTYAHILNKSGKFDGIMAMGVMPHVEKDDLVVKNMNTMLNSGGSVFIEFRNKLFSLFTFNRNTVDFITEDILEGVDNRMVDMVKEDLKKRLRVDQPVKREKLDDGSPGYDAILSKLHNPLDINNLFERNGFKDIKLHWYHYHPSMPYLDRRMPQLFRKEAIKLEHEASGWRGYFLCSAFVVEAVKC
jgi:2-polyprenyl-3-methyl-5-hydroxy-6-metoxy-1,4-benzoquinol methylase